MTKEYAVKRLETILNHTSCANGYQYKIKVNNWENNEKSRIYFSIVETRVGSKHYAEKKYGYIDNHTGRLYLFPFLNGILLFLQRPIFLPILIEKALRLLLYFLIYFPYLPPFKVSLLL